MPEPSDSLLPADDESAETLITEAEEFYAAAIAGWEPSDATPEKALMAGNADEAAVQYALMRATEADWLADYGEQVLGVVQGQASPAVATTTWIARTPAPAGGHALPAGTTMVIDAPAGLFPFETMQDTTVAEGELTVAGVIVQAIDGGGTAANGATGQVLLDTPPAWVESVSVTEPATGGSDGEDDASYLAKVRRAATLQSLSPIHVDDLELIAPDVPGVFRLLARDNFDLDTGDDDVEGVASVWPIDVAGEAPSAGVRELVRQRCAGDGRRILNGTVKVGTPTYTTIDAAITVTARLGADTDALKAAVGAAVTQALSPATHGLVPTGEVALWRQKQKVRRYEIAAAADRVELCDEVTQLTLSTATTGSTIDADGNVSMTGYAPLPRPGTVTVTVVPQ